MRKLNELEVGTKKELNVLVTGLEERMTKNNRPYVVFQVTDGETVADVRKWDATVAEYESYENTVVNMDIRTSVYNNNRSYDTDMILPTPLPASDFVRKVPEDIAMMMSSIMERVKQISSPELREIKNSLDAMNDNSNEQKSLILTLKTNRRYAWIEIKDTGKGISKENLEQIFLPFYSSHPYSKHWGIGLTLTYKIIHAHEGKIDVVSTLGKGTATRIFLPLVTKEGIIQSKSAAHTRKEKQS